jgi:hypothetical protein
MEGIRRPTAGLARRRIRVAHPRRPVAASPQRRVEQPQAELLPEADWGLEAPRLPVDCP